MLDCRGSHDHKSCDPTRGNRAGVAPDRSSWVRTMSKFLSCLSALVLAAMLFACGDELTDEAHIENSRSLLDKARTAPEMYKISLRREAIAELKGVLNRDGKNLEASMVLGKAFFEMGEWEDAENWLSKAQRLGGDPATIVPVMAQILLNLGESDKLDRLSYDGLDPEQRSTVQAAKAVSLLERDRPELAAELIDTALQSDPVSPFAEVAGARVAMTVDGYDEAQRRLTDIVNRHPDYVPAWNLLGDVESARGMPGAATAAYRVAVELSEDNVAALMNGVLMKFYLGKGSAKEVNALVLAYPSLADGDSMNFLRGLALMNSDKLYEAQNFFYEALDVSDAYPQSLYYLAAIDLELGATGQESDFSEKALSSAYKFLRYFPNSAAGMKLAAKIELGRGRYKKVEEILRPMLYRNVEDTEALNFLARAYLAQGKNREGIEVYSRLVELQPDSIDTRARLAAAYLNEEAGDMNISVGRGLLLEEPDIGDAVSIESPDSVELLTRKRPDKTGEVNLQPGGGLDQSSESDQILSQAIELQPGLITGDSRRGVTEGGLDAEELGMRALQSILSIYPGYQQADILIILRHLRQRRVTDAIAAAQAYRVRNPSSATAYSLLGHAYLANGEKVSAKAAFENAFSLRPGDPDAGNGLADLELQKGNIDTAREYYREILKYDPEHTRTWMRLAASYARKGEEDGMLEVLEEATLANPRALEPRLARVRYQLAKGDVDAATLSISGLTEDEKSLPMAMEVVAAVELATGKYDQALKTVYQLLRMQPDNAQYQYMMAKAYAGVGDYKRVLEAIERAIELGPDHFHGKLVSARLALQSGREEEFQSLLSELRRVGPASYDVMELDARLAQVQGHQDLATRLLQNVFQRYPTSDNLIEYVTQRQLQGDIPGAIDLLEGWIENHPGSVAAREKLAELYVNGERANDAILQYREILRIAPENAAARNNLAWHLLDEDPEAALEQAEKANRLSSGSSAMLDTLAVAQLKNNLIPEARRSIERARSLDPDSSELRLHEAQIKAAE